MLAEDEVGQLVANALGGPVDPPTVRRLSELSQGNAMYLLELVAGSVESGSLANLGDIWSLVRPLAAPSRLIELVAARLEGMEAGTLEATRCVAVGEPLPLAVLEQLVGPPRSRTRSATASSSCTRTAAGRLFGSRTRCMAKRFVRRSAPTGCARPAAGWRRRLPGPAPADAKICCGWLSCSWTPGSVTAIHAC